MPRSLAVRTHEVQWKLAVVVSDVSDLDIFEPSFLILGRIDFSS